jgi:hypothetical protein
MKRTLTLLGTATLAVLLAGCEARTDRTDAGGVILSLSDFDGLPMVVSASADCCLVKVDKMTLSNIAKRPGGRTSELMNVEIQSYEVTYEREDRGTRKPPKLIQTIFGVVPVNGTSDLENYPVMRMDQFNNVPIKDLIDFGFDRETNSTVIRLKLTIRFFGRTLSGDPVVSAPASFSVEVIP